MSVPRTVLLTAAACLLLASSHTPAQAPPAVPEADQRLKALENKMDRVLKLLEVRSAPVPARGTAASAIEVAQNAVLAELRAKAKEREDFQKQLPAGARTWMTEHGWTSGYAEQIGKLEVRRSELRIKMGEMTYQLARVKKAYKEGGRENGNTAALHVIKAMGIQANGIEENPADIIIEQLGRERKKLVTGRGEKDQLVADVDRATALVRKIYAGKDALDAQEYMRLMQEEVSDLATRIETLTNTIDAETRKAQEANGLQARDEQLLREIDGLRNKLKVLNSLLAGDGAQKAK